MQYSRSCHGELLQAFPWLISSIQGELTTPTGAILSVLADDFGPLPPMIIRQIGCGAGSNDWTERLISCEFYWRIGCRRRLRPLRADLSLEPISMI